MFRPISTLCLFLLTAEELAQAQGKNLTKSLLCNREPGKLLVLICPINQRILLSNTELSDFRGVMLGWGQQSLSFLFKKLLYFHKPDNVQVVMAKDSEISGLIQPRPSKMEEMAGKGM